MIAILELLIHWSTNSALAWVKLLFFPLGFSSSCKHETALPNTLGIISFPGYPAQRSEDEFFSSSEDLWVPRFATRPLLLPSIMEHISKKGKTFAVIAAKNAFANENLKQRSWLKVQIGLHGNVQDVHDIEHNALLGYLRFLSLSAATDHYSKSTISWHTISLNEARGIEIISISRMIYHVWEPHYIIRFGKQKNLQYWRGGWPVEVDDVNPQQRVFNLSHISGPFAQYEMT